MRAEGAEACSSSDSLRQEVIRRLGRDPFQGEAHQIIEGIAIREPNGFRIDLFERDETGSTLGSRTLRDSGPNCRHLEEAASLAIALIIDPDAKLAPPMASPEASPTVDASSPWLTTPSSVTATPQTPAQPKASTPLDSHELGPANPTGRAPSPPDQARQRELGLTASSLLVSGIFPKTAWGFSQAGALGVYRRILSLELGAMYLPEHDVATEEGELGYGATAFDLGGCVATDEPRLRWFSCLSFQAGTLHTIVRNPDPLEPGDRLWLAGRGQAGARLLLIDPVWLEARLFGLVPITRWHFRIRVDNVEETAYRQPIFMPGASLGLGVWLR